MAGNTTLEAIRKNQILDAALRIIGERGAPNVTMDDIASAAEMSKGGVAHYFSSKDALFLDAVKMFYDRIFERGKETRDQFNDPLEKLLSFTWLYNWEDPEMMMGYRLLFDFQALAAHDDRYSRLYHEWVENWIRLLKDAIEEGAESGLFLVKDADSAARTVSAIYHGIANGKTDPVGIFYILSRDIQNEIPKVVNMDDATDPIFLF